MNKQMISIQVEPKNPNPTPNPNPAVLTTPDSRLTKHYRNYLQTLLASINARFADESWKWRLGGYRRRPAAFAREVLGSSWTAKQEEIARYVKTHRRVAVKSANGVGKTYLAADLALWFLYTHENAIVLTVAPTHRQLRFALWKEIHRRLRCAQQLSNQRVSQVSNIENQKSKIRTASLPGRAYATRLHLRPDWYAVGISTDKVDNLQGFHAEHLLIIIEEASGIPDSFWEACETMAVGDNNRIVAIGNPLRASGRFFNIFRKGQGWRRLTVSALDHPNIRGRAQQIKGCVTKAYLQDRIADWCEELHEPNDENDQNNRPRPRPRPRNRFLSSSKDQSTKSDASDSPDSPGHAAHRQSTINDLPNAPDTIKHEGRTYRPNDLFRTRVMGEFPSADDHSLIPLRWIEAAIRRTLPQKGHRRMAADIARFGEDSTVIGIRHGPVITELIVKHGQDTAETAGQINRLAYEIRPETISIDSIGIGAGVVDRLYELKTEGVEAINVSLPARDPERFFNRRAELYWGLRERFRTGDVDIPDDDRLIEELSTLRYQITSRGQIRIESKDELKKRLGRSPDYADTVAMLFDGDGVALFCQEYEIRPPTPSAAQQLRNEMKGW